MNGLSEFADLFAFGVTVIFSVAIAIGAKESSIVNNVFTFLNVSVVLFVVVVGSFKADLQNWQVPETEVPEDYGTGGFAPYGIAGIVKGAAICFYGFIGFDCIATAGEEAKNPRRAMPIAIVGSLFVVFLAYFGVSTVITMMLPYYLQDENAPLIYVFDYYDWPVAKYIVSVGAIFGLCASLMGSMFPLPRIVYAMSNDGLIFKWLGEIHPRFHTPLYGTMFVGILTGTIAAMLNLTQLIHMLSIGTLMAYSIVAACVLLLRYEVENPEESLRVPAPFRKNIIRFLWNSDGVRTPNKLTSLIVMWEVTVFCKSTKRRTLWILKASKVCFVCRIITDGIQFFSIFSRRHCGIGIRIGYRITHRRAVSAGVVGVDVANSEHCDRNIFNGSNHTPARATTNRLFSSAVRSMVASAIHSN